MTIAIAVFTGKSPERMFREGGSGHWVLNPRKARMCEYVVCIQNRRAKEEWADGREPHGSAFLIGKLESVVPSSLVPGKWVIHFSEFAILNRPHAWKGARNPVHYTTLEELGIDVNGLEFRPVTGAALEEVSKSGLRTNTPLAISDRRQLVEKGTGEKDADTRAGLAEKFGVMFEQLPTITEAKAAWAIVFGVSPEAIEITIRW